MNQLTVGGIISNAFNLGLKNFGPIVGTVILWIITLWIPYINVGTTIGLVGMVVAISKGNILSPTEIFNSRYRQYMGEFFLVSAFVWIGTLIGYTFLVIPGIVISVAWGQALYILLDKEINPLECLFQSNKITYGKKWTIFLGMLLLAIILYVAVFILYFIFNQIATFLGILVGVIGYVAIACIFIGGTAYIYQILSRDLGGQTTESA